MNMLAGLLAVIIIVVPAPPSGSGPDQAAPGGSPPVPTQTVPTQTVPTQTVPTQTVPTQTVPTQTVPTQPAPGPPVAAQPAPSVPNTDPATRPTPSLGESGATAPGPPEGSRLSSVAAVPLTQGNGAVVKVTDPVSLDAALGNARPGQIIELADGTYNGRFTIGRSGRSGSPITLRGSRAAIINGGDTSGGDDLHLDGASYWQLVGFTVTGGQKGIMADRTDNTVLSGLDVGNTGAEGVHLGDFSSNDVLQNSVVHDTGKAAPGTGEGLHLGTARADRAQQTAGLPDRSDHNSVIDNTFKNTAAENIDVEEDTSGGLVAGNSFDGTGLSGVNFADSVLDLKGTGYRIMDNVTSGVSPHLKYGFQTQVITDPATSGCGNTFLNNVFEVSLPQVIALDPRCGPERVRSTANGPSDGSRQ